MRPIYQPSGKAREYADYALNLYTGCPNGCDYCYAPSVLRKSPAEFAIDAHPRTGIVEAARRQLAREDFGGKLIHLCFTCDPYPTGMPTMITREAIEAIHEAGAFVQLLTEERVARREGLRPTRGGRLVRRDVHGRDRGGRTEL